MLQVQVPVTSLHGIYTKQYGVILGSQMYVRLMDNLPLLDREWT